MSDYQASTDTIPFDPASPNVTSGIRLGTPAVTTRGMTPQAMKRIAQAINIALTSPADAEKLKEAKGIVEGLCQEYPLYPDLG